MPKVCLLPQDGRTWKSVHGERYLISLLSNRVEYANIPQESKQSEIELKDDDPDTVDALLQHIYGADTTVDRGQSWSYWLNLHVTADKYLEPTLSGTALEHFRRVALKQHEPEVIFDIIDLLRSSFNHEEDLCKLAKTLQDDHLQSLLGMERFRSYLDNNREEL